MTQQTSVRKISIGIAILIVCIAVVFGFRFAKKSRQAQSSPQSFVSAKVRGSDSAPVRIVDFSDFQCPACRMAAPVVEMLMEKYPGKIQLVFKHFPLRMHPWSPIAHQAAECSAEQGKFWEFYRKVYENQPVWSALPDPLPSFVEYARDNGVDLNKFSACMTDSKVAERIAAEKKEGEALDVKSTPTFFINGKMFAGGIELQLGGEPLIRQLLGLPPLPPPASVPAAQTPSASAPAAQAGQTKAA